MRNSGANVLPYTCAWIQYTIEIRPQKIVRIHVNRVKMKISKEGRKEKKQRRPNCSSGLPSPRSHYYQKQWMNYLTNLTYRNNATYKGEIYDKWTNEGVGYTSRHQEGWIFIRHQLRGLIYCISKASRGGLCVKISKGFRIMRSNKSSFSWAIYKTENYHFNLCHSFECWIAKHCMPLIIFLIVGDSVSTGYIGWGKFYYGLEPVIWDFSITVCGVNYQQLQ